MAAVMTGVQFEGQPVRDWHDNLVEEEGEGAREEGEQHEPCLYPCLLASPCAFLCTSYGGLGREA